MSLFAPQKMSLNESKRWASKSQRLKDSCLANTLLPYYLYLWLPIMCCRLSVVFQFGEKQTDKFLAKWISKLYTVKEVAKT